MIDAILAEITAVPGITLLDHHPALAVPVGTSVDEGNLAGDLWLHFWSAGWHEIIGA